MVHTNTKNVVEILLKTWMICEATVNLQDCLRTESKQVYHQFKSCAGRCFDMARELMEIGSLSPEETVACLVECQTCLGICKQYEHIPEIAFCGAICENCLSVFGPTVLYSQLN
ncbi:MAG: hypothetical protein KIT80_06120 [Chitinophagaceae bacterium]|nr:hypothetical protein [Chitinophagaceae bacterium]MCW5926470.1 hypothetical protein [Chitinophagaceae bacterium]